MYSFTIKLSLIGCELITPITNGCLALGTWHGILFV
ncbi:MAG: YjbQ family protein [Alcanivoracaceae bacterium]|nr:YjbQ family protein [Alcanivoracaceae bacterium]